MKQNTILAAIFFFLLAIGISATCQEPRNLQVRVLQVIKEKGHRIDLKALSVVLQFEIYGSEKLGRKSKKRLPDGQNT